ncbi:MAG: hypothetical protein K0Q66_1648 [Chitinophagaceae bacterium]|nr:hypothetical protein [Chitinophagaceae bacterium]
MKNIMITGILILGAILVACGPARRSIGLEEGWDLLGEQKVNFVRDKDVIEVRNNSTYTALQFKVEGHEIRLNELNVIFQNGDKLSPAIDAVIAPDQSSRVIDLATEGKAISRIEFKYRTTGNVFSGRANVLVFGKRFQGY